MRGKKRLLLNISHLKCLCIVLNTEKWKILGQVSSLTCKVCGRQSCLIVKVSLVVTVLIFSVLGIYTEMCLKKKFKQKALFYFVL